MMFAAFMQLFRLRRAKCEAAQERPGWPHYHSKHFTEARARANARWSAMSAKDQRRHVVWEEPGIPAAVFVFPLPEECQWGDDVTALLRDVAGNGAP